MTTIGNAYLNATTDDLAAIDRIANRYAGQNPRPGVPVAVALDLLLAHHAQPLNLHALADAPDRDFYREVIRLRTHVNRRTGELSCSSRFARVAAA